MQVSKISLKNNAELEFIADFLAPHTKRAYLVGGSVRDMLLGREIYDFDIEIYDIKPEFFDTLMQKLGANGFGKSFFVYKFKNYDLSLARTENKVRSGHKGFEVSVCDDEKLGARRRDFTINSMMINIFNDEFLDFYGGLKDLKRGFEALQKLNLEQVVLLNDSTKHENAAKFRQMLERAREFISDEGLFLYLYLNFFGIEKKDFFAKTQLKKELLNAAKQPFFKDEMSDLDLAQIALQMPLKSWLGLWDEKRVQRARALKLYDKALRAQIDTQELENLGFSGKKLGEQIQKRKNEWLKAYLKGIK